MFSTHLFLLLVAHSVSAVHEERPSLYHIHTVHFSPLHNTSSHTELTAALLLDGGNLDSELMEELWKMKKQVFLHESAVYIDLLEICYNGTGEFVKRHDCEIERFSTGDVTSLTSTAENRSNGKTVLYFNVDTVQCVVLDSESLPVEVVPNDSPNLSQISRNYLVQRCMKELLRYLDHYSEEDSGRTAAAESSEDEEFISGYMLLLFCIAVWVFWRERNKHLYLEEVPCSGNIFDPLFARWNNLIDSMIFRIKNKFRKRKAGTRPVKGVHREYLHVLVNEDQDGGDADRPERRFAASMDIPLTLAGEDDDYGQITMTTVSKDILTRTARLITAGGQLGSRTISLPAFVMEGEEDHHTAETNPQNPLLPAVTERFAASMDIPPTLAEKDDDDQNPSKDRLTPTAGLTKDGGRQNLKNVSLPNLGLERNDSSDSQ